MNPYKFKSFVKDIEGLYYRTRLSSIEDCFIRLSQEASKINAIDFIRWLTSETKSKGKSSIIRYVSMPEIFSAFSYLYNLSTRYNSIKSDDGKFRIEIFNQNPKVIEIINTMNSLMGDYSVNSILLPFQHVIGLVSKVFPIPPSDVAMVKRDLQAIVSAYGRNSAEQAKTLKAFFTALLNKFSEDIGGALERVGRKDLADKIRTEKILYRPDLLSKILPVGYVDYVMGDKIQDTLHRMTYGSANVDSMYEYIKREALDFVGAIDKKQYELQSRQDQMQEDLKSFQGGKATQKVPKVAPDITESQWLNPRSLAIISATLYAMYLRISKQR